MENNNNAPAAQAVTTDNGSASQDSFLTDGDNSKDVPVAPINGANDGDDNLSPISDSELEDDMTNDTTDARPVTPSTVPEADPVSQSNDAEKDAATLPSEDGDTEDVEMKEADQEQDKSADAVEEEKGDKSADADQENNNSPPADPPPSTADGDTQDEPMDVDETDKAKRAGEDTTTVPVEDAPVDDTSQTNLEEDSTTNVSGSDLQVATNTEEAHFQAVTENNESMTLEDENQPQTDMLNDDSMTVDTQQPAEEEGEEQQPPDAQEKAPEEDTSEQTVPEIEIGTFRDVTVATEEILSQGDYDKIVEEMKKNISKRFCFYFKHVKANF